MALPKLNEVPTYEMKVPSSGQSVTYRPFLVKEQKNLLIAFESENRGDVIRAVTNTINACIEDEIENPLSTFDVDYLFTKIRSKSVGETSTILVPSEKCETKNEVTVDLDKSKVEGTSKKNRKIKLTDDITVTMRYPTYDDYLSNQQLLNSTSSTEALMNIIIVCLESVLTEDERVSMKDEPHEEIVNFLESMTTDQFSKISEFALSMPSLTQKIIFTCTSCDHKNKKTLRGMDDFF